jgi:hypothetical protein
MATEKTQIDGTHRKTPGVWRQERRHRGLRPCDQALEATHEPPPGAHLVTPRRGYTHHGIYVGRSRVVQYGGLSRGLRRGPVEEVSLPDFAQGYPIWIRMEESRWSDGNEIVRRARLRLGENRYHVLRNNCEHFCEWCVRGEHRSYQVDELIAGYSHARHTLTGLLARVPSATATLLRSAINAMAQTAKPPSASPHPTHPVEVQPKPAAIAKPPSQGPSAFATLKAEWLSAAARL